MSYMLQISVFSHYFSNPHAIILVLSYIHLATKFPLQPLMKIVAISQEQGITRYNQAALYVG